MKSLFALYKSNFTAYIYTKKWLAIFFLWNHGNFYKIFLSLSEEVQTTRR